MHTKSLSQRITEVIAVVFVVVTAVVVGRPLMEYLQQPSTPKVPTSGSSNAAGSTKDSAGRVLVKSIAELPAKYPDVQKPVFLPVSAPPAEAHKATPIDVFPSVSVRQLKAFVDPHQASFMMSPDGKTGIALEQTPASTQRFARWDLQTWPTWQIRLVPRHVNGNCACTWQ